MEGNTGSLSILSRYFTIWLKLTENSFISWFSSRLDTVLFLTAKIMRFGFFVFFLLTIFYKTKSLSGYSVDQIVIFYLTYNLIDTAAQLLFREVYRFRSLVVSGDFDLVLVKPVNPLFRSLAGGADPLDLVMLLFYIGGLIYSVNRLPLPISLVQIITYMILVFNGLVIAAAFHILVLSLAVVTTEIDHAILIYRDLVSMGRLPVDVYSAQLRAVLTFIIPVGVMMTFPVKVLLGLMDIKYAVISVLFGLIFLFISIGVWKISLRGYSSASS